MNEKDSEKLELFFTDEALYYDPDLKIAGLMVRTKQTVTRTLIAHMNTFSRFKIKIDKVSANKNEATVNWTIQGIFEPESSTEKKFSGIDTFNFDDEGKIHHFSSVWNRSEHSYGTIEPVFKDK